MKKISANECKCEACAGFRKLLTDEAMLHTFIGKCPSNVTSGLNEFQGNLEFTNAVHWDVGYSGEARYFIYRDDDGNLLAWYDRIKKCGFKPNFENLIGAGDLIAQV